MQIVKTKKTSLLSPFNASDITLTLREFTDHKGNAVALADFENLFVVTIRQGNLIEMVLCDGLTQNADGSATLEVATNGRDLSSTYPYTGSTTGEDFGSGAEVVNGDDPYTIYAITVAYTNSLVISGAPNASGTVKGIGEVGTTAEIDADAADGSGDTTAPLLVTPAKLGLSKYATRLPSAEQKIYLNAVTGMIIPYIDSTPPTGFLNCDNGIYANDTYPTLALLIKGRYGLNTGVEVTGATTDILTSILHGLTDGDIIFFSTTNTLPTGLTVNTPYYVRDATGNTFKVALTSGGVAVDITSTGTGTHYFHTEFRTPDLQSRFPLGYSASAPTKVFTFASRASNVITITGADNHAHNELQTGQAVLYTAASGAMTGLTHNTTYYVIRVSATTFSLATSVANANAGTAIALSSDGTGAQTFTATYTVRPMAQKGGEEIHALTNAEMPSHSHNVVSYIGSLGGSNAVIQGDSSRNSYSAPYYTDEAGSNTPHNTMPLFTVVNYIIKT